MRVLASTLVALLVASISLSAQQRTRTVPMPRPAPAAPVASPGPAFTSRLILRAPRPQPGSSPNQLHINRAGGVFAVPFFWGWGVPLFYWGAPAPAVPLADGPPGGVQLDVQPWGAQVYVDGALVGRVEDFRGYYKHLEVPAGPHQITIVEAGYQPMILDVVVTPGRTVTYRGTLNQAPQP